MKTEIFEDLALRQLDALYGYALRLTRDTEAAEDLVQETYARAMGHCGKIADGHAVRPTLFRILHNLFVDHWRKRQRNPVVVSTDALAEEAGLDTLPALGDPDNPRDRLLNESLPEEVERALSDLPEDWREAIWLREIEDYSYEEISRITETPVGTVRSRLARARRALVASLESYARCLRIIPGANGQKGHQAP